jgi:hypothetical protein
MTGPLLAPFLVAFLLRVALSTLVPVRPVWDGAIYARSADFIAHGRGYTRTAIDPDEPAEATAFYPVGFPAMLAPLRWVWGRNLDLVAQSFAGALLVVIAGLLGRRAGGPRIGTLAAWLVALWPGGILLSASWMSEPFFSLFVGAASLLVAYTKRSRTLSTSVALAVILGLGALVRPTAIPMLVVYVVGLAFFQTAHEPRLARGRALAKHLVVALLVAFAVMLPWTIRNAMSLDAPAIVSTNGGANLLVGTSNEGSFARIPEELDCSSALPEVARDRCRAEVAIDRIREAPFVWLARGVLKLVHTFGHESAPAQAWGGAILIDDDDVQETASLWALAIDRMWWLGFLSAAIAGAVVFAKRSAGSSLHVAIFAPIVGLAALHFVMLGGDRYHAPVVMPMAVLAAIAIDLGFRRRA